MNKIIKYLSVISFFGLLIVGCSELKKDIPTEASGGSIVHGQGFADPKSPNFHGNYLRTHNWDLQSCQQCHGATYAGGTAKLSCNNKGCHTAATNGPEACNTCHGNFNDPLKIAPPRSTTGDTAASSRGVGAHNSHLFSTALSNTVSCQECHNVPQNTFAPGHLDSQLPAEITFNGPLGNKSGSPVYDSGNLTCANTYCHGNFSFSKASAPAADQYIFTEAQIVGANFAPTWTKVDGSQKACGTCHGLPPKGHVGYPNQIPVTACGGSGCHTGVVDANGNIIDKTKHINGSINVKGQ